MLFEARTSRRGPALAATVAALAVLGAAGALARAESASRRVSMERAQELVRARAASALAVPANDLVVEELSALTATPLDRARLKAALSRAADHRAMVEAVLQEKGLPRELLAVPLVESGYQNLPPDSRVSPQDRGMRGAGLWMFIPQTARRYGLQVGDGVDQRLDVARETVAAAAYLRALHERFGDWPLALAAYNQGETRVEQAVAAAGTRDAYALTRAGALNRYHATVLAAVLLLENPGLLE